MLYRNGAIDSGNWAPPYGHARPTPLPEPGEIIAWRYAAWRVLEVRPFADVDLSDDHLDQLRKHVTIWKAEVRAAKEAEYRPKAIVVAHERGPILTSKSRHLSDGTRVVHLRGGLGVTFNILPDPYMTCSCHGDPWPCQDIDRAEVAAADMARMDKLLATAEPGVCAHCLEVITTRQSTVTFPEPSRFVPGAPGPTFHAGRAACWAAAEKYEREGRLVDDPDVTRLASCPGVRFIHESRDLPTTRRLECTAAVCAGRHGPAGYRHDIPCWYVVMLAGNREAFARPPSDCGYRSGDRTCLGHDIGGSAVNEVAADLLWRERSPMSRAR